MLIQQPYRQFSGENTLFWITVLWSKNLPSWHEVLLIIIYLLKKNAFQHSESKHYFNTDFAGYSIWGFIGLACMILSVPSQPNLPRFHLTIVHLFSLMAPESSVCSAEGCSPHLTVNGEKKNTTSKPANVNRSTPRACCSYSTLTCFTCRASSLHQPWGHLLLMFCVLLQRALEYKHSHQWLQRKISHSRLSRLPGVIRTQELLDHETTPHYWLTVYAMDRGVVPLSSFVEVFIEVQDVNDNAPQTSEPVYYPSVVENSPKDVSIIQINAVDPDARASDRLSYRITSGNPQGFFAINARTGKSAVFLHEALCHFELPPRCLRSCLLEQSILLPWGRTWKPDVFKGLVCIIWRF